MQKYGIRSAATGIMAMPVGKPYRRINDMAKQFLA